MHVLVSGVCYIFRIEFYQFSVVRHSIYPMLTFFPLAEEKFHLLEMLVVIPVILCFVPWICICRCFPACLNFLVCWSSSSQVSLKCIVYKYILQWEALIVLFCWGAQPLSKLVQLQSPRDHSFNPENQMKAVYICFIYLIHICRHHGFSPYGEWMCPVCLIRANRRVNSTLRVRYTQTRHHRMDHLRAWKEYLRIEKKTIYGLKRLFIIAYKRLLTALR